MEPRRIVVAAAGIAAFLNLYAPQALLPTLVEEFGQSPAAVGWTVGASTLAIALSSPFSGLLVARIPRRRLLGACFSGILLTALGCALSPDLGSLIGWRFAQGLFLPPLLTLTMAYIGEAWPAAQVGRVMAFYVACNGVGGFLGRFLTGLVEGAAGWRQAFVLLAVLNAVAAWLVLRAIPNRSAAGAAPDLRALVHHLGERPLQAAFATGFSLLFTLSALFTYITFHLAAEPFRLGPVALGSLFAVYLVGIVVTPSAGRLIRPGVYGGVILGSTAVGLVGVALTLAPSLVVVLLGLVLASSSAFVNQSAASGYVTEVAGERRSTALGMYLSSYYLGGSAGAIVPGLLWGLGGWPGTVLLLLAVQIGTMFLARRFLMKPGGCVTNPAC